MFGKRKKSEPGLVRLQKDVTRDRLRLQQYSGTVHDERAIEEVTNGGAVGRLYQVFVAMGEA